MRARREDWPERLSAAIAQHRARPFEWGVSDCACLFRDCVAAMTGDDILAGLAPWYSAATAVRSLKRAGYDSAFALVSARCPSIAPSFAGRGDCGFLAERDALSAPAIIMGSEALSRNERGFVLVPASALTVTFKI